MLGAALDRPSRLLQVRGTEGGPSASEQHSDTVAQADGPFSQNRPRSPTQ